jgi:predicted butyrate kinase (DUF1464 family)
VERVIGIDPGTKSWDFFGFIGEHNGYSIFLDTSILTKNLIEEPAKFFEILEGVKPFDLMVAPSGFGLPLKNVQDLTETDISYILLKPGEKKTKKIVGLGEIIRRIKETNYPAVIVPSVKHLTTVPKYKKINKIDLGTADKVCTAVVGIRDQIERYNTIPENTNFIMIEIGFGFTAVLAIENGQIIDGIGGSNIMGLHACGCLDGEIAHLIGKIKKQHYYQGGVTSIAGYNNLSLREVVHLSKKDAQSKLALDAFMDGIKKATFAIASAFSDKNKIKDILLAGRGINLEIIKEHFKNSLSEIANVREMKTYSQIAKRSAQGAAFIASGLLGGKYKSIIENLKLKEASGTVLDYIYIPYERNL